MQGTKISETHVKTLASRLKEFDTQLKKTLTGNIDNTDITKLLFLAQFLTSIDSNTQHLIDHIASRLTYLPIRTVIRTVELLPSIKPNTPRKEPIGSPHNSVSRTNTPQQIKPPNVVLSPPNETPKLFTPPNNNDKSKADTQTSSSTKSTSDDSGVSPRHSKKQTKRKRNRSPSRLMTYLPDVTKRLPSPIRQLFTNEEINKIRDTTSEADNAIPTLIIDEYISSLIKLKKKLKDKTYREVIIVSMRKSYKTLTNGITATINRTATLINSLIVDMKPNNQNRQSLIDLYTFLHTISGNLANLADNSSDNDFLQTVLHLPKIRLRGYDDRYYQLNESKTSLRLLCHSYRKNPKALKKLIRNFYAHQDSNLTEKLNLKHYNTGARSVFRVSSEENEKTIKNKKKHRRRSRSRNKSQHINKDFCFKINPEKVGKEDCFKINPEKVGDDFATSTLTNLIFPGCTTLSRLILADHALSRSQLTILVTNYIAGDNLGDLLAPDKPNPKDDTRIKKNEQEITEDLKAVENISNDSIIKQFILNVLTGYHDGTGYNYVANKRDYMVNKRDIVCIDNDSNFEEKYYKVTKGKHYLDNPLTILPFLKPELLNTPVSSEIKKRIKSINPYQLMAEWSRLIDDENKRYKENIIPFLDEEQIKYLGIPISLSKDTVESFFANFTKLQEIFSTDKKITVIQMLEYLNKTIALCYQEAAKKPKSDTTTNAKPKRNAPTETRTHQKPESNPACDAFERLRNTTVEDILTNNTNIKETTLKRYQKSLKEYDKKFPSQPEEQQKKPLKEGGEKPLNQSKKQPQNVKGKPVCNMMLPNFIDTCDIHYPKFGEWVTSENSKNKNGTLLKSGKISVISDFFLKMEEYELVIFISRYITKKIAHENFHLNKNYLCSILKNTETAITEIANSNTKEKKLPKPNPTNSKSENVATALLTEIFPQPEIQTKALAYINQLAKLIAQPQHRSFAAQNTTTIIDKKEDTASLPHLGF